MTTLTFLLFCIRIIQNEASAFFFIEKKNKKQKQNKNKQTNKQTKKTTNSSRLGGKSTKTFSGTIWKTHYFFTVPFSFLKRVWVAGVWESVDQVANFSNNKVKTGYGLGHECNASQRYIC